MTRYFLAAALAALVLSPQSPPPEPAAFAKLTTVLQELRRSDRSSKAVADAIRGRRLRMSDSDEVQVYVLLREASDDNIQKLTEAGATIEISDPLHRRVQAHVPATRLDAVAALPFVDFIRLPNYAVRQTGAANTEGDAILRSDAVRRQLSLDGTGVRVGVISDGIKGVFASGCTTCDGSSGGPIASGDLPAATGTRNSSGVLTSSSGGIAGRSFQANQDLEGLPRGSCAFAGAGAEGTALLEIVHDLAPGAQLSFANADTDLAFNQAVNFLAASNDVVVDDLGFFGEAYDGTSPISSNTAAALNNSSFPIRTYITSAGNEADEHYLGSYVDSGVEGGSITGVRNPGHLHLFQQTDDTTDVLGLGAQPYNLVSLPQNGEIVIFLTWDDRFGGSGNNYDLYLIRQSTGAVVAASTDIQSGSQDPVEFIDFVNSGASDFFRIVVQNVRNQAQGTRLNLFSYAPECAATGPRLLAPPHHDRHNFNTASRSVGAQGDAGGSPVSVISVGAICSASAAAANAFTGSAAPDESCLDKTNSTVEFFSSRGPTLDGRLKPDVSAIDGVSVTGAGGFPSPFFGTSAAAPHVAGIAALLLQAAPCLAGGAQGALDPAASRSTLRDLIVSNAVALSTSAPDTLAGHGRADALASANKTLPAFGGGSTLTVSANTPAGAMLTPAQLGFTDPTHCQLTRLFWTGGCGTAPAATMTCPVGTTRVSVSASNNGAAFSPATDLQITVTSFGVAASPASATVAAGQSATYQINLQSQGGPFGNSVTLGCANLPSGAACSFNPSVVTPGNGSAPSTLTLSTSARPAGMRASTTPRIQPSGLVRIVALAILLLASAAFAIRWTPPTPQRALATLAVLALGTILIDAACGGSEQAPPSGNSPPSSSPTLNVSAGSLTFAPQALGTTSAAQTVTLTSAGSVPVALTGISTNGDFAQTNNCGNSLAAAATCAVTVTFMPTATGTRTGGLSIADNAANSPQSVTLTGTGQGAVGGTPAGTYQVSITGLSGSLGQSSTVTLIVQ